MTESNWNEAVVLDEDHLNGYTGGDTYLARDVLVIFADNAPIYLEDLISCNSDSWRATAHKLKGAARGIGAWRLARAAERAEFLGQPPVDCPKREQALDTLKGRLDELLAYINAR